MPKFYAFMDEIGAPMNLRRSAPRNPDGTQGPAPTTGPFTGGSIPPVAWVNWMVAELERGKNQVLVETPMIRLLVNRLHEVIGVLAEGPKGPIQIFSKAVVLATGGWPGNAQLMTQNVTRHFGGMHQRNAGFGGRKPALIGDGLFAATQIGAAKQPVPAGGWEISPFV